MSCSFMLPSLETNAATIRKPLCALFTRTPCCCTTCGSNGVAVCSLFCTCTCAVSASVPLSKLMLTLAWPLDWLLEDMYIMPSRPCIACSMIWVTEFSTTCADAPG